jgi:hypothetical protein
MSKSFEMKKRDSDFRVFAHPVHSSRDSGAEGPRRPKTRTIYSVLLDFRRERQIFPLKHTPAARRRALTAES